MVAVNDTVGAKVKAVLESWEAAWNASDMTAMWQLARSMHQDEEFLGR